MNKNYLCRPKRKSGSLNMLCLSLLVLSIVFFYLSNQMAGFKAAGQLFSVVLLLIFVQLTTRFLLTEYRYGLEDGILFLSSRQGKKEKDLGSLPITDSVLLYSKQEWKREKAHKKVPHRVSICQNPFPDDEYYLLSPGGDGFVLLVFEPDELLVSLLRERIGKNI